MEKEIKLNNFTGKVIFSETVDSEEYLGIWGQMIPVHKIKYDYRDVKDGDVFECKSGFQLHYSMGGFFLRTDDKNTWLPKSAQKEYFKKL